MMPSKTSVGIRHVERVLLALFSIYLGVRWLGLLNSNSMIIDALVSSSFLTTVLLLRFGDEVRGSLIKDGIKLSIGIVLLLALTFMGLSFFTGLSLNPYASSISYLINNLVFMVPRSIAVVAAIALTSRFLRLRYSLVVSVLMILSMNLTLSALLNTNVLTLQNILEVLGPSILEAVAIVLISKRFGIVSAMVYGLVLSGSIWLNPLVPNVRGELMGLVYIMINLVLITYVASPVQTFSGVSSRLRFKEGILPVMLTGLFALAVLVMMKHGYYTLLVLTGSMKPHINPGDLVLIGPGHTKIGEIIAYIGPGRSIVVHRVIDILHSGSHATIITKGDANTVADPPVSSSQVLGRLIFKIPYIGLPILEIAKVTGSTAEVTLMFIGIGVLVYFITSMRKRF